MKNTCSLAVDSAFILSKSDRTLLKALTKDSAELSVWLLLVRLLGMYVTKYDLPHPFKVVLPFQLILFSIMTPLGPPPHPLTLPLFHSNLKFLILTSLLLTQPKLYGQSLRSPPRIHSHSTPSFSPPGICLANLQPWLVRFSTQSAPAPVQLNVAGQKPATTVARLI